MAETNDTVYHYSSPDGLKSILENKTLWFTDSQFLNDKSELEYYKKPLKRALDLLATERSEETSDTDANDLRGFTTHEDVYGIKEGSTPFSFDCDYEYCRYYMLCTAMDSDNITMWNHYTKNGAYRGYNLALDAVGLDAAVRRLDTKEVHLTHGRVIYDFDEQVQGFLSRYRELYQLYDQYDQAMKQEEYDYSWYGDPCDWLEEMKLRHVNERKVFTKNPAFAAENEYRFVLAIPNDFKGCPGLAKRYRMGDTGIVTPYIELEIAQPTEVFKRITVSPTVETELAKQGFIAFLRVLGLEGIGIEQSSVKLR